MKRKAIVIILILVAIVGIVVSAFLIKKANTDSIYITGCEYIQNGEYELAYSTLQNIDYYKDVQDLLIDLEYLLGVEAFDAGDLDTAEEYLKGISDYNDAATYLNEIYYRKLVSAIETGDVENAENFAALIPEYKDIEYQKQLIIYEKYIQCLDANDINGANEQKALITDENLIKRADLVYQYCNHGYSILNDLLQRTNSEAAQIDINEIRCYQYSYNNNVEVPVYMIYTDYTDSNGNVIPRYYAFLDHSYYGFCSTIVKGEIDMNDEAQLYTFLKIEPYWDDASTLELSVGYMQALCHAN